jgi:tRNA (cmo5U34)-methyltransferase
MYIAKQGRKPKENQVAKRAGFRVPAEWTFKSKSVAAAFDSHVREQLPWYDVATGIVAHLARSYVPQGGVVVDVGASTGNVGRAIAKTLEARKASLVAVDSSHDMVAVYDAPGQFVVADAVDFDFAARKPDLIVCFLSLMFVPVSARAALVERMRASLAPGGAVVVFDKMIPNAGYLGTVAFRLTLAAKYEAGAKPYEIIAKELSIEGLQRPMSPAELPGFVEVFRFGDFAGFVHERAA